MNLSLPLIIACIIIVLALIIFPLIVSYKTEKKEHLSEWESKNKVITKIPVGSSIVANNHFWLHGRRHFRENKELVRELLRIRGSFFNKKG